MSTTTTRATQPRTDRRSKSGSAEDQPEASSSKRLMVPPPKLRRRPALIAAGVAAVAVGALISVWAYTSANTAQSVIGVRETITRGEVIERDDLVALNIAVDPALHPIPAADAEQVIGQRAALDIAAGGLVTREQVTDEMLPPAGSSVVGVSVGPAMLPANQVSVGDQVRVVETPGTQPAPLSADGEQPELQAVEATVVGLHTDPAGNTIVNLVVPARDAAEVASWSAASRAAIVVDSTEQ